MIRSGVRDSFRSGCMVFGWFIGNIPSSLFCLDTRDIHFALDLPGEQPVLLVQRGGGIQKLYVHWLLAAGWLVPNSAIR